MIKSGRVRQTVYQNWWGQGFDRDTEYALRYDRLQKLLELTGGKDE